MALHHSEGDMLEAGHDAVVNAASVAGRGLALTIRWRFPHAYKDYMRTRTMCGHARRGC